MDYPHQAKEQLGPVGAGVIFVIMMAVLIAFTQCSSEPTEHRSLEETYPGPWRDAYSVTAPRQITMALIRTRDRNCDRAFYRNHVERPAQAWVYCTSDGVNWSAYAVSWDRDPHAIRQQPVRALPPPRLP